MIRGIYFKIFLWFCLSTAVTGATVFLITAAIHAQSLGPRWMTGVLNQYARSAVDIYTYGGKQRLLEFLDEIAQSSRMRATLLDADGHDIAGRGIPKHALWVSAEARAEGHSRFETGLHWTGASIISRSDGTTFILVAEVAPYEGLWTWQGLRTPALRLAVACLCVMLLSLLLARRIAAPIRTLQGTAARIADGDLSARALPAILARNDEIADLARDFDRMAERVEWLLRKQQDLLADVSHELRSPLTRLTVSLELLQRGETDSVERMQTDLECLEALIGQILTLARLQTSHEQRTDTLVNLRSLLESVAEDACFEGARDGKCVVIARADDCSLEGDAALLRSCFENVVRNAVRFTRPQTDVSVSLAFMDENVAHPARIVVSDHGEGVPQDALGRLFEPFYRVSKPGCHKIEGTGLGLSIAQRVVLLHRGTIRAWNKEGGGLEVEIQLPANRTSINALCS